METALDLGALLDRMSIKELRDLLEKTQETLRRKQIEQTWVVYQPPPSMPLEAVEAKEEKGGCCGGGSGCC